MAERFYVSFAISPGHLLLQGPEARHLSTVLRAKTGQRVTLFCGDGAEYPSEVVSIGRRDITLQVGEAQKINRELPFHLEVAAAFPKGDRGDFLVEKLTELGAGRIVPLITERSIVHPRLEKLNRTVIEASKQCGRNKLMAIAPVTPWREYCCASDLPNHKFIAHFTETKPLELKSFNESIVFAIGPEGGWANDEVEMAKQSGWQVVGLGARILRAETAAIALASYLAISSARSA